MEGNFKYFWLDYKSMIDVDLTKEAKEEGVSLKVYNPTSAIEVNQLHAPRLANLSGKTICELSNGSWEHDRTFPWVKRHVNTLGISEGKPVPIIRKAENITIVVVGGDQGMHGYRMQSGCCDWQPVTKEIKLPVDWQGLIAKSIEDLGPIPAP